ncbi:MAG: hypothetical protein AAFZ58_11065 [Pseudomonadota bacterium]
MPRWLRKELIVFGVFGGAGLLLLPLAVYWTGVSIFGEYAGEGLGEFVGRFARAALDGSASIWFLIAAPYLVIQLLRLGWLALTVGGNSRPTTESEPQ